MVAGTIVGDTVALRRNLCSTCSHRENNTVTAQGVDAGGVSAVDDGGWVDAFEWSDVAVFDSNICFDHGESIR